MYRVLVAAVVRPRWGVPDAVQRLVNRDRRLPAPESPLLRPAEVVLDLHRREIFDRGV